MHHVYSPSEKRIRFRISLSCSFRHANSDRSTCLRVRMCFQVLQKRNDREERVRDQQAEKRQHGQTGPDQSVHHLELP